MSYQFSGISNIRNNIIISRANNTEYMNWVAPTYATNNIFYSEVNQSISLPSWQSQNLNANPNFVDTLNYDFRLQE